MPTRLLAVPALALALALSTSAVSAQAPTLAPVDEAAIRASVLGLIDAWNKHDMQLYVSYMAPDVQWVNVRGSWWRGKDAVYREHLQLHQTIFKTRQLHTPEKLEIRAIGPDAAIATSIGLADAFTSPSGQPFPAGYDCLTEVFVRRNGRWLLIEGHNTPVAAPPAKP